MKKDEVPQYSGKPLPFSLDPVVIPKKAALKIETALTDLLKKVEDFTTGTLKDKRLLTLFGLPENLDPRPTPLGLHIPFARFDFLFDGNNFQCLELNTDGTSGYNVMEWLGDAARIPVDENPNKDLSMRLLGALLEHSPEAKRVCLVDFVNVETSWEQLDLISRWSTRVQAVRADPSVRVWSKGDLIYRRALSWQLRSRRNQAEAFLQDWEKNLITVVGGWSSDIGMNKAWPAMLKPSVFPETKIVDAETAGLITQSREDWVLKAALSHSGHAVIRGMDLSQDRWKASLQNVLAETKAGRVWVAQKRIEIPLVENKPCEFGIFFLNGKPSGYMCRWGHSSAITETSEEIFRPVRIV